MAVNDFIGVQIHGRYQSQNIVNTFHYMITEQAVDEHAILQELVDTWLFQNKLSWLGRHIDSYTLMGLKAFSLSGANKRPGIAHVADPGAVTGTEMPSSLCRVITLYTDSDNYRRRGRVMLSGSELLQFVEADGAVTPAEIALMETLGETLITELSDAGNAAVPGLLPIGGPPAYPFEQFTTSLARKTPGLVRSRRVRVFGVG